MNRVSHSIFQLVILLLCSSVSYAGIIEIGASGSYRKSNIDSDAYDESRSMTGSLSYYFNDASAIELSYTYGQNKRAIAEGEVNGHVTTMHYSTVGLDFVYTFGPRGAFFRPYVKAGANYIVQKRLVDQYRGPDGNLFDAWVAEDEPGLVPSGGAGFRLALTQSLSLKVGVDAWTSRPTNRESAAIDYAARAGLSIMF